MYALTCKNRVRLERSGLHDDANTENDSSYSTVIMECDQRFKVKVSTLPFTKMPSAQREHGENTRTKDDGVLARELVRKVPSAEHAEPRAELEDGDEPTLLVGIVHDGGHPLVERIHSEHAGEHALRKAYNVVSVPKYQRTALQPWDRLSHERTWLYPVSHCTRRRLGQQNQNEAMS